MYKRDILHYISTDSLTCSFSQLSIGSTLLSRFLNWAQRRIYLLAYVLFRSAPPRTMLSLQQMSVILLPPLLSLSSSLHFNLSSIILYVSHTYLSGPSHFSFYPLLQLQSFRSHRCFKHSINFLSVPATRWVLWTYFLPLTNSDSTNASDS